MVLVNNAWFSIAIAVLPMIAGGFIYYVACVRSERRKWKKWKTGFTQLLEQLFGTPLDHTLHHDIHAMAREGVSKFAFTFSLISKGPNECIMLIESAYEEALYILAQHPDSVAARQFALSSGGCPHAP